LRQRSRIVAAVSASAPDGIHARKKTHALTRTHARRRTHIHKHTILNPLGAIYHANTVTTDAGARIHTRHYTHEQRLHTRDVYTLENDLEGVSVAVPLLEFDELLHHARFRHQQ
jgi:hypothetical protein